MDYYIFCLYYIKMSGKMSGETTYYPRNKEAILYRAKDYYENNKEVLWEQARNKYRELSEEEKYKKRAWKK